MKTGSAGDTIVDVLATAGVELMFGFPGEATLPLYTALQRSSRVRHILARCPRCAGYMADSYARLTGRIGVCDAPGGIGSPFTTPALHEAKNSSTPLLFLASGTARSKRGRWATSECDQQALFQPVTKWSGCVDEQSQVADRVHAAMHAASTPRTGPAFLEIPADILEEASESLPRTRASGPNASFPSVRPRPSLDALNAAASVICGSERVVIVAGGGVHLSNATSALRCLVHRLCVPVATSLNGKGAIAETHPLSLGVTGSKGNQMANRFVEQADCILVLGSKLGDKTTNGYAWPRAEQAVVHVDSDPMELLRDQPRYLPVLSDVKAFCEALAPLVSQPNENIPEICSEEEFWERGATDHLCRLLSQQLPSDAVVIADASVSSGWAGAALRFHSSEQRLISPRGSGSIGFALPAAIGACFARPKSRIIAIGGDGGFAMAMHEMETASRYRLPLLYFLLNNQRLGLIDWHATALHGGAPVSQNFVDIDWVRAASAFGWKALHIKSTCELEDLLPCLLETVEPTLIDYQISPSELAPDMWMTMNRHGGQK